MKIALYTLILTGIALCSPSEAQAQEKRLVGYANGKPLYVKGAPIVRKAQPAKAPTYQVQRPAPRVYIGSTSNTHGGPNYSSGGNAYSGGYGWNDGYYANGYNSNAANCRPTYGWGHGVQRHTYVQPFQAAASRGYSWIPRYGSTTAVPRYTR